MDKENLEKIKYEKYDRNEEKIEGPRKKRRKKKSILRKIFFVILILLMIFLGILVGGYWFLNDKISRVGTIEINEAELGISEQIQQKLDSYRNVVIYGIDANSNDYEDGYSDSIIIASLNEDTGEVSLTSVYRDTYVEIEGYGLDKITQAYNWGGPELAMKTLNTNLDLNITEFVTVNFDAVEDIVDYVGGITIKIDSEEYSKIPGIYSPGTYTLNGEQALKYARIRYAEGGDFTRTERLRTVLEAVANKVAGYDLFQLNDFVDFSLGKVYTNIDTFDILELLPQAASISITESEGWPYEVQSTLLDAWYSVPVTLESNVKELHKDLFGDMYYLPSDTVKEISGKIIEDSGLE